MHALKRPFFKRGVCILEVPLYKGALLPYYGHAFVATTTVPP